ncbi:MAG: MFS transporter [Pyramidobacter sp.]|nr:MFS transporter [Pyramidobacter sp.]
MRKVAVSPRGLWNLLGLAHFINDLYAHFIEAFIPLLIRELGISMGAAGFLSTLGGLMHSVVQPVSGYVSDRLGHSAFIRWGILLTGFFGSLIPLSLNYPMALACCVLWGLGTALFHPQAQGAVGYLSGGEKIPLGLALFALGGTLGSAVGPLYGVFLYEHVPHAFLPVAGVILPLAAFFACGASMPRIHEPDGNGTMGLSQLPRRFWGIFKLIWPVWCLTISRDLTKRAMIFLLPLLIASKGGSLALGGSMIFGTTVVAALAPLWVARWHPDWTATRAAAVSIPAGTALMCAGVFLPLVPSLACMVVGLGILSTGQALNDALAQSLAVHDRSTVSSLTMGLSYGLGGVIVTPAGMAAEAYGLNAVIIGAALIPLAGLAAVFFVWPRHHLA